MNGHLFNRVLLPLDGSELAARALDQFFSLPVPSSCEVALLRVVHGDGSEAQAEAYLNELKELLSGHSVSTAVRSGGDPASVILHYSVQINATLLVLSTHGQSGLLHRLRGCVAEEVIRGSSIPVLAWSPQSQPGAMQTVLVPHDGTADADQVLPVVADLAVQWKLSITLLHVSTGATPSRLPGRSDHQLLSAEQVEARLSVHELAYQQHILKSAGLEVACTTMTGTPEQAILDAAEGVDLVAMATHGRTGASRWLLGSIMEAVLKECAHPLLIIRMRT